MLQIEKNKVIFPYLLFLSLSASPEPLWTDATHSVCVMLPPLCVNISIITMSMHDMLVIIICTSSHFYLMRPHIQTGKTVSGTPAISPSVWLCCVWFLHNTHVITGYLRVPSECWTMDMIVGPLAAIIHSLPIPTCMRGQVRKNGAADYSSPMVCFLISSTHWHPLTPSCLSLVR